MTPRIAPIDPPYAPAVAAQLEAMTPPQTAPIALFRTFVHNFDMTDAMTGWGRYELSRRLSVSMRDREIVIDRVCARCGCEYEWGVHVAYFAVRVDLTDAADRLARVWRSRRSMLDRRARPLSDRDGRRTARSQRHRRRHMAAPDRPLRPAPTPRPAAPRRLVPRDQLRRSGRSHRSRTRRSALRRRCRLRGTPCVPRRRCR